MEALLDEFDAAQASSAKAIVLTGQEKVFCAGVDLFTVLEKGRPYLEAFLPTLDRLFLRLLTFPKPIVAAVNGHAIAGGCIILMCCDYRVMTCGPGKVGLSELTVGVPFPTVPFEIARAALPPRAVRQAIYAGRLYSAEETLELGLVDELVDQDQCLSRALASAELLANLPVETFQITKRQMTQSTLDRIAAHRSSNDANIWSVWGKEETLDVIRGYMQRAVKGR
jgi:enoyl-CoA hydratase